MADILDSGSFKIVSLSHEHLPIGVNYTKPGVQPVRVGGPVHDWVIHKVGPNRYKLSIGGYRYIGVHNGKVIASTHPEDEAEWEIIYRERQHAYTIALVKHTPHLLAGWTVPINLSEGHQVEVQTLTQGPSEPPFFRPIQLFLITKDV